MSDNDVYLPFEGEPRTSNEDFDEDGFSPAVFRSRLEQKIPATEYLVCCRCVLFSLAKSMLKMGSCVRFCWLIFQKLCLEWAQTRQNVIPFITKCQQSWGN